MPIRICSVCGKEFERLPRSKTRFCSEACRLVHKKEYSVRYYQDVGKERFKQRYKPVQPHEIICKGCGNTFMGKYRQRYCQSCLNQDDKYMRQLLSFRKEIK